MGLAIVGVYGVLAYAVGQRRREVSIRLALGAEPRALQWLFVRKGLDAQLRRLRPWAGVRGRSIALDLFLVIWRHASRFAYYIASAVLIAAAALTASYVPARQAAAIDPMETLRGE